MVDGEVGSLVVYNEICFLEKGAAEGVLGIAGSTADGEVVGGVGVPGIRQLQVEGGIWEDNIGVIYAGVFERVDELKGYRRILCLELFMNGVINKIKSGPVIVCQAKCLLKTVANWFWEPEMRYC